MEGMDPLLISARFCGPNSSGNGGWSAGALASHVPERGLGTASEVTLHRPPPLEHALRVCTFDDVATLLDGDDVVATARAVVDCPTPVPGVAAEIARAAESRYPGLVDHPFPHCFACGPQRAEGDGLRLFPGTVDDVDARPRVACTWTPDPSLAGSDPELVDAPVAWAALDCPGAWSVDLAGRTIVLGRITAVLDALPRIGEEHVVVGAQLGRDGRKWHTASTLYDADRRVVGRAEHVWFEIDPAAFS
ncbi:hypothetical protein GCM10009668_18990 [Nocardioides dubius]|uniref:Thioesterase family protein n=2 Tax=Nocardioides dubius TaxID=317019 RepID=A0ABP4EDT5_9ACTN